MSSKEELDNSIVDAVDTYKKAKREELVKAMEDAWVIFWDAFDVSENAAWADYVAAKAALIEFDKENT